jgi:hypothetical protein
MKSIALLLPVLSLLVPVFGLPRMAVIAGDDTADKAVLLKAAALKAAQLSKFLFPAKFFS